MEPEPDEADPGHTYEVLATSEEGVQRGDVRGIHTLYSDEPDFLPEMAGEDRHPAPVDYLVFGLVSCQASVLKQCLEKSRISAYEIRASATIADMRGAPSPSEMPDHTGNRIDQIEISMHLRVSDEDEARARRCLDIYDQGCIVGQSLRAGIEYSRETSLVAVDSLD